jgi:hypothetical protein
MRQNNN